METTWRRRRRRRRRLQLNGYATGPVDASAKAINGGLDIYGGWNDDLWTQVHDRSLSLSRG
jgi:hypothetical protein